MVAALPVALALALAARCAPDVAPQTTVSVAQAESGLSPLAINDNTAHQTFAPETVGEAVAIASDLVLMQHHNVDLGLMQVNSANLAPLGLSIPDAFDACHSIAAGARILTGAYQTALRGALSAYNTGDQQRGIANGYVAKVVAASASVPSIQTAAPAAAPATAAPTPAAPPASSAGWDVFASAGGGQFVFSK